MTKASSTKTDYSRCVASLPPESNRQFEFNWTTRSTIMLGCLSEKTGNEAAKLHQLCDMEPPRQEDISDDVGLSTIVVELAKQ